MSIALNARNDDFEYIQAVGCRRCPSGNQRHRRRNRQSDRLGQYNHEDQKVPVMRDQ